MLDMDASKDQKEFTLKKQSTRISAAKSLSLDSFNVEKNLNLKRAISCLNMDKKVVLKPIESYKDIKSITIYFPCNIQQGIQNDMLEDEAFKPQKDNKSNLQRLKTLAKFQKDVIEEMDEEQSQPNSTHRSNGINFKLDKN